MTTGTTLPASTTVGAGLHQQTQQPKKEKHLVHWFRKGSY